MLRNVLNIRLGIVDSVDRESNTMEVTWLDSVSDSRKSIPISHPYVGRGWGVRVGIEPGTVVAIGFGEGETPFVIGYWTNSAFETDDPETQPEIREDEFPFRRIREGEIILQSKLDSVIALNELGDVVLETADGNVIEIDNETDTILQKSAQNRVITEAGETIVGMVKRDRRTEKQKKEDALISTLTVLGSDLDLYSDIIGGDNLNEGSSFHPTDNRALTEYHSRILEYADSCLDADLYESYETPRRDEFGFLMTKMGTNKYSSENELIEIYMGTKVNDKGRIVGFDVNEFFTDKPLSTGDKDLATMFEVKFNTKGNTSKWLVAVNKEGYTRLNIPAGQDTQKEFNGVSLHCKTDGSIILEVGKELSTSNSPVTNLGKSNREGRSISIDAEGNIEIRVKGDQSLLIGADGSVEVVADKINFNKGKEFPVGRNAAARENDTITVPCVYSLDARHPKALRYAFSNLGELEKLATMIWSPLGPCFLIPTSSVTLKGVITEGSENVYIGDDSYD